MGNEMGMPPVCVIKRETYHEFLLTDLSCFNYSHSA
jgi:hypothetical protein